MRPTTLFGISCFCWLAAVAPASAGGPLEEIKAAQMMEKARQFFGIDGEVICEAATPGSDEIVICAKQKRWERIDPPERVPKPDMKVAALGPPPIPPRPGVKIGGCFLQRCPKKQYFIDFSKLPEAPPGSDADKMAKRGMADH